MPANPQVTDGMVEKAARAMRSARGLFGKPSPSALNDARVCLTAALADHVVVPKAALDWLHGEAPDADGKWFGECEDAVNSTIGKYKRSYWWRSKFRAMISAAPLPQKEG